MLITSDKVAWAKQGTVTLIDGEPVAPDMEEYEAAEGWKMVRHFVPCAGWGDYQFPYDQILVVLRQREIQSTAQGRGPPLVQPQFDEGLPGVVPPLLNREGLEGQPQWHWARTHRMSVIVPLMRYNCTFNALI